MSKAHASGKHPRLAQLEGLIRDGEVDTLVVAFTDMQGRLMGKRVQAQAFLIWPRIPAILQAGHFFGAHDSFEPDIFCRRVWLHFF